VLTLSDGYSFGELALEDNKPRAASILCLEDSHFAVLEKEDYKRIL
jgi:CRP-like cAMP-binding protein